LDLRTSNFKFEFVFIFQPFDTRIQASLIRRRLFCLESGALLLQWCTVWWFLCSLPAINSSNACRICLLPLPYPPCISLWRSITLSLALRPWRICKLSKWQILVAQTQSRHQSTATWLDVLADCTVDRLLPGVACMLW